MPQENRASFIGSFELGIRSLLLSMVIAGVAVAQNPVPLVNQPLVPDTKLPGGAGFTLTVNGSNFISGSVVNWNGSPLATTYLSSSRVTATVPASNIASAGTASVSVVNPGPGGGASNAAFFPVTLPIGVTFGESTFAAGSGAMSTATGDFNDDGKLDLVAGDAAAGEVSILLGNGDGTFQAPVSYALGQGSSTQFFQLAVGDFNADGKLDFVVSDYADNYVSVFLGNGDGTFKPGVTYAVGNSPTAVAVADLNGDGKLDLVTSNQDCSKNSCGTASVSVLLGNGDGTFQTHTDYNGGAGPNWILVGDFNGDGKLDLAVVDGQGTAFTSAIVMLLGNGDGTFTQGGSFPLSVNAASGATADFNGDGKLDIAVADNIGTASILLGNGDGTFQPRVDYTIGSFPFGAINVGDLNEDGHLDLAIANSGGNSVTVLLGNGDGTFVVQPGVATGNSPHGVVVADFNRDGRLDMAVPNSTDNNVSILEQNGAVSLSPPSLNFGVQTGTSTKNVTLKNIGTTTLTISSITITGTDAADFTETNTCGSTLGVGARCTISVTFTPSQLGPRAAALTLTDSDPSSPQSLPLTGTGATTGPNATLSAASLSFGTLLLNTTSPAQQVTLSNYGTQALSITSVSITRPFKYMDNCGKNVAPGASCAIQVTFMPNTIGNFSGTLSFSDNAPNSPQTVSLTGTGTVVELNPTSLSFGTFAVGTSTTQSITLTNVGKIALSISGISVTGADSDEFSQSNTCGSKVGAGQSCTISVTFKPTEAGGDSAEVSLSDNGGGSPQMVNLSGTGCVYNYYHKCVTTVGTLAVKSALTQSRGVLVPGSSGSSVIGTRVLAMLDSERNDPFLDNGTKRELLVRFWYPAEQQRACNLAEYTAPLVWNYFSQLTGLPLPQVITNSCQDAPVASGVHPVVIFTHGYTGTFTDYTFLFEDLASRGYVVASIDHTYEATAVEFPDGRLVKSVVGSHLANTWQTDDQSLSSALAVRLDDVSFVLNELERLNVPEESFFAGRLDLSKVAIAGHSLGGLTTWLALQRDPRFKGGILLDPYLGNTSFDSTEIPVLLLAMGREQPNETECRLWSHLLGPRLWVNLRGAEHLTPSDAVWLAKGAIRTGSMGLEKTVAAIRDYVADFLDVNLRVGPLRAGPSAQYPDAEVTQQKRALCSVP